MVSRSFSFPEGLHEDTVAGIVFFVITSVYFQQSLQLSMPFSRGQAGPAFYPMLLSAIMYLCSIVLIYRGLRTDADGITIDLEQFIRPIAYIIITIGYALTLISTGYIITTLVYTFFVTILFEYSERKPRELLQFSAAVSVGITALGYIFFEMIFNIRLPSGILA